MAFLVDIILLVTSITSFVAPNNCFWLCHFFTNWCFWGSFK